MNRVAQEIPKIGLVMESVKIVRWLRQVGDAVVAGEPLLEVETEKSLVEIEAAASGRLAEILLQAEQQATVGDRVGWIETADAAPIAVTKPAAPAAKLASPDVKRATGGTGRVASTPVARKFAAEQGVNLSQVAGSGPGGRIQLQDVQRAAAAAPTPNALAAVRIAALPPGAMPLTPMRRALARAMTLSNAAVPQFSVTRAMDCTAVQALRRELNGQLPAGAERLSLNDFLLHAVARTLLDLPELNATFVGEADSPAAHVEPSTGAHIGLVVAVDNGLLVPVLHAVEALGLAAIANQRRDLTTKALAGRLRREQLEGATFSISNLGARGPDRFVALINPPQSAILAVGRQRECAVVRDGAIVARPVSELTLTVDHRLADGLLAARFLDALVTRLEGRDFTEGRDFAL